MQTKFCAYIKCCTAILLILITYFSRVQAEYVSIAPCTPENYIAPPTSHEIRDLAQHLDEDVKVAFQGGKKDLFLKLLCRAAAANIEAAEMRLGLVLYEGYGFVDQDEVQSRYWLKRSADKGNARSKYLLSSLYREGRGGPPMPQTGMRLLREAADAGEGLAMFELSSEYVYGRYIAKNRELALYWARQAKQAGVKNADNMLQLIQNSPPSHW